MNRYRHGPFPFGDWVVEHHGGGPHSFSWVIFGLLLALLLLTIVSIALDAYCRSQGPRPFTGPPPSGTPRGGRALAVLDVRYARGEISRKDYLRVREDLGTPAEPDTDATTEVQPLTPGRRWRKRS